MIEGRSFFAQPIRHDIKIYQNIRKIAIDQWDDHTIGCLLQGITRNCESAVNTQ